MDCMGLGAPALIQPGCQEWLSGWLPEGLSYEMVVQELA